jgi:hypothetical protein
MSKKDKIPESEPSLQLQDIIRQGKKYSIRLLNADERKKLLTERCEKAVNVDGEKYVFAIDTDDDSFLVDAFLIKKHIAGQS